MDSNLITAFATIFLVMVGLFQVVILIAQTKQSKLNLMQNYQTQWVKLNKKLATLIFIGRDEDEYYQIADKKLLSKLIKARAKTNNHEPTIWARDAVRSVCGLLSDICVQCLNGNLNISDIYSLFGSQLLRHGRPLRKLLDKKYHTTYGLHQLRDRNHVKLQREVSDWLVYHDGIRRRCLILIDLLWAEAARLEDLPPSDLINAAETKKITGNLCRKRLAQECIRLNWYKGQYYSRKLSYFLRNSEYKKENSLIGIDPNRIKELEKQWTDNLLGDK